MQGCFAPLLEGEELESRSTLVEATFCFTISRHWSGRTARRIIGSSPSSELPKRSCGFGGGGGLRPAWYWRMISDAPD